MRAVRAAAFAAAVCAAGCASNTTVAPQAEAQQIMHGPASWYGQEFAGRTTANGEIFDPMIMTAAHRTLPFGTLLDVTNPKTGQTVRVRVNDRGPFVGNRMIDLSYGAAQQISLVDSGGGDVDVKVVQLGRGDREPPVALSVTIPTTNSTPISTTMTSEPAAPPVAVEAPVTTSTLPDSLPAVAATPSPDSGFAVQVEEQKSTVDTRRQVSASGRSIEDVPVTPVPPSAILAPAPAPAPVVAQAQPALRPSRVTPPPARASHDATTPGGKYVVQVGAFSQEGNAKVLRDKLKQLGEQSYMDHNSLYRVRLGPFATREQAIKARERLEAAGISAIVVAP
jgi:rare lipoprotein A